ncbi:MAG: ABC transporter permease [Christensenellaceae bacterium]|jgi:oligopeptide transport system permease protein|nr:ABC transporter permease [Christensenellaceae bacterium]
MLKTIIKRILIGVATMFVLITVTFFLVRLMPGSPFEAENVSTQMIASLEKEYGLDQPLFNQYVLYLEKVLHGDLGISYKKNISVVALIARGMPATMQIGLLAFLMAAVVGIGLGIWQASTKSGFIRGLLVSYATLGVSLPGFVTALLLIVVFGAWLQALPVVGLTSPKHYILPVIAQAFGPIATISRLVKSTYSEAMQMDYVTMARAKGLSKWQISLKHILKNAILPVITYFGPAIAFLLTGSFVVESLFSIPGIGKEFVSAISNRDYTLVLGLSIFIGGVIIIANLLVDILCAIVDPRIKFND